MTRLFYVVPLFLALSAHAGEKPAKEERFTGKVVTLASLLAKKGVAVDDDAVGMVLQAEDGKTYPLVKNAGSRMFFKDKGLLGRAVHLTGRLVGKSALLDVTAVHTVVKGKLHDVYYWCDNCALAYSEPGSCLCCGAAVKLVEVEVGAEAAKVERLVPRE